MIKYYPNRKRVVETGPPSNTQLIHEYMTDAAYYFFRAATRDENLTSALHRMRARKTAADLENRGISLPPPEAIRERAITMFGDRIH